MIFFFAYLDICTCWTNCNYDSIHVVFYATLFDQKKLSLFLPYFHQSSLSLNSYLSLTPLSPLSLSLFMCIYIFLLCLLTPYHDHTKHSPRRCNPLPSSTSLYCSETNGSIIYNCFFCKFGLQPNLV